MVSDRQLRLAYAKFNRLYWGNELPSDTVLIWEPVPKCDGATCPVFEVRDGCFEIKIDPALKGEPCWWRLVLLHECIHLSLWKKHPKHQHGKAFQEEKNRIYALGALRHLW